MLCSLISVLLVGACAHGAHVESKTSSQERTQSLVTFRALELAEADSSDGEAIPAASKKPKLRWTVEVEPKKGGSLGWKTTVYVAGFFVLKFPGVRNVLCHSKIGVPMRNRLGPVSDLFAEEAILAAGQIVGTQMQEELRAKDPEERLPAESICLAFRQKLMARLRTAIPGVRVENSTARHEG